MHPLLLDSTADPLYQRGSMAFGPSFDSFIRRPKRFPPSHRTCGYALSNQQPERGSDDRVCKLSSGLQGSGKYSRNCAGSATLCPGNGTYAHRWIRPRGHLSLAGQERTCLAFDHRGNASFTVRTEAPKSSVSASGRIHPSSGSFIVHGLSFSQAMVSSDRTNHGSPF